MREVRVYKLVSRGTIEELTLMRQLYKNKVTGSAIEAKQRKQGEYDDRRFKVDGDFVNFWVYYEVDKNLSRHVLLLEDYAHGADAPENAWVLLEGMPPGPAE